MMGLAFWAQAKAAEEDAKARELERLRQMEIEQYVKSWRDELEAYVKLGPNSKTEVKAHTNDPWEVYFECQTFGKLDFCDKLHIDLEFDLLLLGEG